jgi:hypothetical protein
MVKSIKRNRLKKMKRTKNSKLSQKKGRIHKKKSHSHLSRKNKRISRHTRHRVHRTRKIKGGGNLNYHDFIPQDLVNGFRSVEDQASNLYRSFIGKSPLPSSSPVVQPSLVQNNTPIPLRTNINDSNASADIKVNALLH